MFGVSCVRFFSEIKVVTRIAGVFGVSTAESRHRNIYIRFCNLDILYTVTLPRGVQTVVEEKSPKASLHQSKNLHDSSRDGEGYHVQIQATVRGKSKKSDHHGAGCGRKANVMKNRWSLLKVSGGGGPATIAGAPV